MCIRDRITRGFDLLAVPVTNALYELFDHGHWADRDDFQAYGEGLAVEAQSEVPVYNLSWYEACAFATWLGCRLPSETEWEYACRGGTTTRFWSGPKEQDLLDVGWMLNNSGRHPHPVATPPTERGAQHPWGLHDLHGNVWEWCQDYVGAYEVAACTVVLLAAPHGPLAGTRGSASRSTSALPPATGTLPTTATTSTVSGLPEVRGIA